MTSEWLNLTDLDWEGKPGDVHASFNGFTHHGESIGLSKAP